MHPPTSDPTGPGAGQGRRGPIACGLGALILWAHPDAGIRHDGLLYTLQALRRLYPDALGGDLYFRYGSQDADTVISTAYALLAGRVGVTAAAEWNTRGGVPALLDAAAVLARQLLRRDRACCCCSRASASCPSSTSSWRHWSSRCRRLKSRAAAPFGGLRLYDCRDLRRAAVATGPTVP